MMKSEVTTCNKVPKTYNQMFKIALMNTLYDSSV